MYKEYLDFAISIAMEAKKINEKYFNKAMESGYKNDKTIVTAADKEINEYLIERVKEVYPEHAVDGEEDILVVTNLGIIIRTSLKEVKVAGRNTLGVRIIRLANEQKVSSLCVTEAVEEEVEENTEVASNEETTTNE